MSLEEALAANTAALVANTAALQGAAGAPAKAPKKAAAPPAESVAATPPLAAVVAPAAAPVAATGPGPSFKDLADALVELVTKKDRAAGVAVLAKYGASKLPVVKPEHFAAFLADAQAALAPAESSLI